LASANFISRILGETAAQSGAGKMAAGPLNMAFRPLEARINDQIVEAFEDPKKLEALLRKARTSRKGLLSLTGTQDFAVPRLSGGLLGSFSQ
jgi:acyl CoA:acetate/3-ketoacid CoA transferase